MQGYNSAKGPSTSIWYAMISKWLFILLVTVLCLVIGLAYSVIFVKPTYTASRSVILRLSVGDAKDSTVITNINLSKIYLPDVVDFVTSPAVVEQANELMGGNNLVKSGGISVKNSTRDEDSLIFSISYTDTALAEAKLKLNCVIESVTMVNEKLEVIEAEGFALIPTQNDFNVSVNSVFAQYVIIGGVAGLVIALAIVVFAHMLDNTVVSKSEFEEVTGISVLSLINKNEPNKNKK